MASNAKNLSGSSGVLYNDRRDFYMRPNVVKELWTDVTPFTTVVSNQQTITGMADPQFKMFEHRNPWQKQYVQTSSSSAVAANNSTVTCNLTASSIVGLEGEGGNTSYNSHIGLMFEVWPALTPASSTNAKKGVGVVTGISSNAWVVKNAGIHLGLQQVVITLLL